MKTASSADLSHTIAQLYQEHHTWLYQWLLKKLRSKDRAEDVAQDTFLKILKSKELLNLKEPKAFLCTTAKHIIIDQARREKIEHAYLQYHAQFADDQFYPSPEEVISIIQVLDQIANALSQLEDRPRQILLMHYLDGISQVEIAEQMQLSIKTIQRDLIKALIYCHHIANA